MCLQFKDFKGDMEIVGGEHYDITKFSREERAACSADGKDPLDDVLEDHLKRDLLVCRSGPVNP